MKQIALIAHDGKKAEMVAFVKDHCDFLLKYDLIATGTTGSHIEKAGLPVRRVQSGPMGGDAQIASIIVDGEIEAVVFLRDPLGKHPHDPDINMLMRICDVHNIPLATNIGAAELLIKGLSAS